VWVAALAALRADAVAPLPGLPPDDPGDRRAAA
jgi:hypothetical protein